MLFKVILGVLVSSNLSHRTKGSLKEKTRCLSNSLDSLLMTMSSVARFVLRSLWLLFIELLEKLPVHMELRHLQLNSLLYAKSMHLQHLRTNSMISFPTVVKNLPVCVNGSHPMLTKQWKLNNCF